MKLRLHSPPTGTLHKTTKVPLREILSVRERQVLVRLSSLLEPEPEKCFSIEPAEIISAKATHAWPFLMRKPTVRAYMFCIE